MVNKKSMPLCFSAAASCFEAGITLEFNESLIIVEAGKTQVRQEMQALIFQSAWAWKIDHIHARHIATTLLWMEILVGDEIRNEVAHDR